MTDTSDIPVGSMRAAACRRSSRSRRNGSVLVCVMVVLLIAGLLCLQTMQTLLIVRRAGAEQRKLRQAREVIELGRASLAQAQAMVEPPNAQPALEPRVWTVPIGDQLQEKAELRLISIAGEGDGSASRTRIVVRYPLGTAGEVTATWEDGR